jgi:hypothetical protein
MIFYKKILLNQEIIFDFYKSMQNLRVLKQNKIIFYNVSPLCLGFLIIINNFKELILHFEFIEVVPY